MRPGAGNWDRSGAPGWEELSGPGWEHLQRPSAESVTVDGVELGPGSRVRLHPRPGGDVMDLALAGRAALIESIEQDVDGDIRLAVVVEDDPGRELGFARQPGHRFFFSPAEAEPLPAVLPGRPSRRVLVAGIGNVFLGDDGFGVALAERLAGRALPAGVEVRDFGIRGMDLAFAMSEYDTVVMLDATPRGESPGTLYVIEADGEEGEPALDAHGMDPVKVLGLVRAFGSSPPRTLIIGCEPLTRMDADDPDLLAELSEPIKAALDGAVALTESLLNELLNESQAQEVSPR
jgi:hydrogenase maturation protease